jgi:hypothetical protein
VQRHGDVTTYTPDEFSDALLAAGRAIAEDAVNSLTDAAKAVKKDARRNARRANPRHAKNVYKYIDYDIDKRSLTAEVGYDKRDQGNLGAVLEYGNGNARNAPQRNLSRALDGNVDLLENELGDAGEEAIPG